MKQSYEKLNIVKGKPPFDKVNDYLGKFLNPFLQKDCLTDKLWDSRTEKWLEVLEKNREQKNDFGMSINEWKKEINIEKSKSNDTMNFSNVSKQKVNTRTER